MCSAETTDLGQPPSAFLWVAALLSWGLDPVQVLLQDPSRLVLLDLRDRSRRPPSEAVDLQDQNRVQLNLCSC